MKRLLAASLILTAAVIVLPVISSGNAEEPRTAETVAPQETVKTAERLSPDEKRMITVLVGDEPEEMSVYDYLINVVAAEMPVSFEPEALKAQAVAARSYLQHSLDLGSRHGDADVCSDAACCQAYLTDAQLVESWGENFDAYIKRIEQAVSDTDGEYLSYGGEAALAVFHSSSAKMTEDSSSVWNELPYLVSVDTPENEENVPNFVSSLTLSELDFRDTVLYAKPEADMTADAALWVGETVRTASGRVENIRVGGVSFTGAEIRKLFSLRSTDFELTYKDGAFTFTVLGYGHGVGMSQYGANVMAKEGADHREILAHYYPGTEIIKP